MKYTILTVLLLSAIFSWGQQITTVPGYLTWPSKPSKPCGTWEQIGEDTSAWVTIDTLGNKNLVRCFCALDSLRRWVYDEERPIWQNSVDLSWMPCGRQPFEGYEQ